MQKSILNTIVEQRRQRIDALRPSYPEAMLKQAIAAQSRPVRSLAASLKRADKGFILECKKASPSKGLIRDSFDPVAIAAAYQPHAAAISVLTEPDYFQGDFAYLQAVSRHVQVPVLCKDFIVDPLQVYLARYFGADAILLMLSVLDDSLYQSLHSVAEELGLEVLTEVSSEAEMQRANALGAKVIGINHRNLHDLSIDMTRSRELAKLAPAGALLVAESGITSNQQVREIGQYVDGFLVGSHLTAQADIPLACRQLIYGEHKVCGLTSPADALMAATAGAVYGGLIRAEKSPRYVNQAQAIAICEAVPSLQYVMVTTAVDAKQIVQEADALSVVAIQLHGQQSLSLVNKLRQQLNQHGLANVGIWYALNMQQQDPDEFASWPVDRLVLDSGTGGSGVTFDWQRLRHANPSLVRNALLAGGIGAHNATEALAAGCAGLDFNSALELQPGKKDPAKVALTFHLLSRYFRDQATTEE